MDNANMSVAEGTRWRKPRHRLVLRLSLISSNRSWIALRWPVLRRAWLLFLCSIYIAQAAAQSPKQNAKPSAPTSAQIPAQQMQAFAPIDPVAAVRQWYSSACNPDCANLALTTQAFGGEYKNVIDLRLLQAHTVQVNAQTASVFIEERRVLDVQGTQAIALYRGELPLVAVRDGWQLKKPQLLPEALIVPLPADPESAAKAAVGGHAIVCGEKMRVLKAEEKVIEAYLCVGSSAAPATSASQQGDPTPGPNDAHYTVDLTKLANGDWYAYKKQKTP